MSYQKTAEIFNEEQIALFINEIENIQGSEVFFGIRENKEIIPLFHGNDNSVLADEEIIQEYVFVVHNHPSGNLTPSDADQYFASFALNNGIGFAIIDNKAEYINFVVPPVYSKTFEILDNEEIGFYLTSENENIKNSVRDFKEREQQIRMAKTICKAINEKKTAFIEAQTGVGKSFAYSIPGILHSMKNKIKIAITTNTIALQEQLVFKDLPVVEKIVGKSFTYSLLMGRRNYLCLYRFNLLKDKIQEQSLFDLDIQDIPDIEQWIETTENGMLTEFENTIDSKIFSEINSQGEICLKNKCKYYSECFYYKSKKKAAASDIVILNHYLFFINQSTQLQADLLPKFSMVIYDEAHNIENTLETILTETFSSEAMYYKLQYLYSGKSNKGFIHFAKNECGKIGINFDFEVLQNQLEILKNETIIFTEHNNNFRTRVAGNNSGINGFKQVFSPSELELREIFSKYEKDFKQLLPYIFSYAKEIHKTFSLMVDLNEEIKKIISDQTPVDLLYIQKNIEMSINYFQSIFNIFSQFQRYSPQDKITNQVLWMVFREKGIEYYCYEPDMKTNLMNQMTEKYKTSVFTSATLAVNKSFDYFFNQLGLTEIRKTSISEVFDSPFDFEKQAQLMIIKDSPLPSQKGFIENCAFQSAQLIELNNGKAFILTTSYSDLNYLYNFLSMKFSNSKINIYAQGKRFSKKRLIELFKSDINSVLIGTSTFWEGVDVPGEALELLIIAKLPFQVPSSPIFKFKSEQLELKGGNSFYDLALPYAVIKLKQGFGRLIRKENDKGVCFIFDPRLKTKSYGQTILASLPKMNIFFDNFNNLYINYKRFLETNIEEINYE